MIKAVLFDYGGVLTPAGRVGSISATIADLYGIEIPWEKLDDLHDKLRRGTISTNDFFEELRQRHESTELFTSADWHKQAEDLFKRSQSVYDLAAQLREHGVKTGILSNVYAMTAELLKKAGSYDNFEPLILSCYAKTSKPDIEIFDLAIKELNTHAEEVLFIDDQEKNIPPAQSLGMHTVFAVDEEQIVRDIKQVLKTENNLDL